MRSASLARIVVLAAFATGCTEKPNPLTPSGAPPPTPATLVVRGVDALLTGTAFRYEATLTLSDGTTRTVTPTWSSSNTDAASVDAAGLLEGRAHGTITLTATHEGMVASKSVQVVSNYGGTWVGTYVVKGCDAPPGSCERMEIDVFSFPIQLEISQTGRDLSEIAAVLRLGSWPDIRSTLAGSVTSDGRLTLGGSTEQVRRGRVWGTFHVGAWDTTLSGRDAMTGHWAQRLSVLQPPSEEIMENEILAMTRASTTAGRKQ